MVRLTPGQTSSHQILGKKLDRFLTNYKTISSYPHAYSLFLPNLFSDHCPCLVDLAYTLPTAETKPYKFQNYLTKHPNFLEIVHDAWVQAGSICSTLSQLCWKLKLIKGDLKRLNRDNFSHIQERVSDSYRLLQLVQVQALNTPSTLTFQEERDLHEKWIFLRKIEESYFRQKSRKNWLNEGDFNTTFFHRMCQVRASYNAIRSFLSNAGVMVTDPIEMSMLAVEHFKSILRPPNYSPPSLYSSFNWFDELIRFHCSLQQCQKCYHSRRQRK